MKNKLWGGRFAKKTHPLVEEFTKSIQFDKKLAEYDCVGSIAHAEMLGKCKIIPKKDSLKIVSGLKRILKDIKTGKFKYDSGLEDIHTVVQDALYKKIGKPAARLHTARSRNDQVALDARMYCKDRIDSVAQKLKELKKAIVSFSKKNIDIVVPGFTHLQNAQPVLLAHQMLAYCEMIDRDVERLEDCRKRVDVFPLGSCALSGTALAIDRKYAAKKLGFPKVSSNSMDAVSDRDFIIEFLFSLSMTGLHLSRLAEDLIIWNSQAFGILDIGEEFSTGSSMMPQKKNPDVLELIRAKSGGLYGSLIEVLTVMKGLPLTYNRDMQNDKEPLFRAVDTVTASIEILIPFFKTLNINRRNAEELLQDESLYATDIMEYLIGKGLSLKEAHDVMGRVMLYCADKKLKISEVTLAKLRSFSRLFNKDVYELLDARKSVEIKKSYGSTNPFQVKRKLKNA